MNGSEIRQARERARLTQGELGEKVGVSGRTVGNWERGASIPRNRAARLVEVLNLDDRAEPANPLQVVSDATLLAEIARRFEEGRTRERAGEEHEPSSPSMNDDGEASANNVAPFVADKKQQRAEHTPHPELLAAYEAGETEKERLDRQAADLGEEDQSRPGDD